MTWMSRNAPGGGLCLTTSRCRSASLNRRSAGVRRRRSARHDGQMSKQRDRAAKRAAEGVGRDAQRRLQRNSLQLWDEAGREYQPEPDSRDPNHAHLHRWSERPDASVAHMRLLLDGPRLEVLSPGSREHAQALQDLRDGTFLYGVWRAVTGEDRLAVLAEDVW